MTVDVARRLETVFARIARERMAGLPILNPALAVAAVGFRPWGDDWVGVLVTPWFMNLVALPVTPGPKPDRSALVLPSGQYAVMSAREDGLGEYWSSPLISPMTEFAAQDEALAVARGIVERVFQADATAAPAVPRGLSRRGFLSALLPLDRAA